MPSIYIKLIVFLIFTLFLTIASPLSGQEVKKGSEFDKLILLLIQDGFEKEQVELLFSNENVFLFGSAVLSMCGRIFLFMEERDL